MTNSLNAHGAREVHKQLHLRMKNSGLDTIQVHVTRKSGKVKCHFTGSPAQVAEAEKILAAWP